MSGFKGREIIATWKGFSLGGVRQKGVAMNGAPINMTSDEDNGWQLLYTASAEDQVTITISGIHKDYRLEHDWINRQRTGAFTLEYPSGALISGTFFMANYNGTGPYNDAVTFEAAFHSSGQVAFLPYS